MFARNYSFKGLWSCLLLVCGLQCHRLRGDDREEDTHMVQQWAESAYTYLQSVDCADVVFTSQQECLKLLLRTRQDMAVYVTAQSNGGRRGGPQVTAVLPDGVLNRAGTSHDSVLVLDPYPTASFGHLILVFFIDYGWTSLQCRLGGGTELDGGECLSIALKNRCYNLLDRKTPERTQFSRRCEINFLPLVHLDNSATTNQEGQLLKCQEIPGYASCPKLRPVNDTRHLICNPLNVNTHRCNVQHETVHTRCRLFETCDHALLVGGGGWNREHSPPEMATNVRQMYHMLRHNGFHKNNIKIFYANGARGSRLIGEDTKSVYPSVLKLAIRNHIQRICHSSLCADSLVVYLNNPTRNDGTMLLWDADENGQASENEMYSISELMDDLHNCVANQVYILADQSFAGEMVKTFDHSSQHDNVVVIGSGRDDEYSYNSEFTKYWSSLRNQSSCVTDVHQHSHGAVRMSRPTMHDGSEDALRTTIFGAPCDTRPKFTHRELQQKYLGCQNVPTKIWINKYLSRTT